MNDDFQFDPKPTKYPFPEHTAVHYLKINKKADIDFDENYEYIDRSKWFLLKQKVVRCFILLVAFPVMRIRMNLRIYGRENLKKHKELLKNGVITVSNHINLWDFLAVMCAVRHIDYKVLVWDQNFLGENRHLIKYAGGIPIPVKSLGGTEKFIDTVMDYLKHQGWLHVYAEGSMWEFYRPIRPFVSGAAHFAIRAEKPVLPLAFSYRKNGFIRDKIFHSPASINISIGEPIFPDLSLPFGEAKRKLTTEMHEAVVKLARIENNIYGPIYKNTERIDYYER